MVTPTQISLDIGQRLSDLDGYVRDYKAAERDAVEKRARQKVAVAKALLAQTDGAVPIRQAQAVVDTEKEAFDADVAEAKVRMIKADMHRVEVHIDALRTSAATVRAEFRVLEHGQG